MKNGNGWKSFVIALLSGAMLTFGGTYLAWGQDRVTSADLERKADKATVEVQYNAILRELADIKARLP